MINGIKNKDPISHGFEPLGTEGFTTWIPAEIERMKRLKPFLGSRRGETEIRSSLSFLPLVRFFKIEYQ